MLFSENHSTLPLAGKRYEPINVDNAYKVIMKLTILSVSQNDFGSYRCVSKNSLGDTDGSIKLYREYKELLKLLFRIFIIITYYLIIIHNAFAYIFRLPFSSSKSEAEGNENSFSLSNGS